MWFLFFMKNFFLIDYTCIRHTYAEGPGPSSSWSPVTTSIPSNSHCRPTCPPPSRGPTEESGTAALSRFWIGNNALKIITVYHNGSKSFQLSGWLLWFLTRLKMLLQVSVPLKTLIKTSKYFIQLNISMLDCPWLSWLISQNPESNSTPPWLNQVHDEGVHRPALEVRPRDRPDLQRGQRDRPQPGAAALPHARTQGEPQVALLPLLQGIAKFDTCLRYGLFDKSIRYDGE